VLLPSLDRMIVHCRWPSAIIVRLPSQIGQYHLHSWEERGIKVSCLRTWHSDPSMGSIVNLLIRSLTGKPLSHQLPIPTQSPFPITLSQHWQKNHCKHCTLVVKPYNICEELWFNIPTTGFVLFSRHKFPYPFRYWDWFSLNSTI